MTRSYKVLLLVNLSEKIESSVNISGKIIERRQSPSYNDRCFTYGQPT